VPPQGVHHIGIAVADLDEAVETYRKLFQAEVDHETTIADQGIRAAALQVGGETLVELVAATEADTPVGRFLAKRGPGMHHIAIEVADIRAELTRLAAAGVNLIDTEPRTGLFGLQVAFIHPESSHGVLYELVQLPDDDRGTHG